MFEVTEKMRYEDIKKTSKLTGLTMLKVKQLLKHNIHSQIRNWHYLKWIFIIDEFQHVRDIKNWRRLLFDK